MPMLTSQTHGCCTRCRAVLRMLREVHQQLFTEFPAVMRDMRPHYVHRLADMQTEVARAERETALLLEAAETMEQEAQLHTEEKQRMGAITARGALSQRARAAHALLRGCWQRRSLSASDSGC